MRPTDDPTTIGIELVDGPAAEAVLPARYRDLGRIAAGGFGEVRRVEDRHLGCVLAMKLLRPEAMDEDSRRRFAHEARLTAWLHHPGVVAVQDLGELADGRLWYTMEEVRGDTLGDVIDRLHRGDGTLRRVVDALMRACQAVASAHAAGVIHRDLKPENVMIGAFGEVRVMDWGLARHVGSVEAVPLALVTDAMGTQVGRVMGTPAYMAPEQARGETGSLRPTADVYALGAMLYTVLAGRSPYPQGARAAWLAVLAGPPDDVAEVAPWRVPDELREITTRAMARAPEARFVDAGPLASALAAWLEGARREAEAEELVDAARARVPEALRLRADADRLDAEARRSLADVRPSDGIEQKRLGWRLEDEATQRRVEARRVEAEVVQGLRAALLAAPDLAPAHDTLADLYRARVEDAEARNDATTALEAELALRAHDRGRHARWLVGDGTVTVVTDPPGATVDVFRVEERERRLVELPAGSLGVTPIVDAPLPRGSYVLVLTAEGRVPVRYPVAIGRLDRWTGVRPGDTEPFPVVLPRSLATEDRYVPAGWYRSGGDPAAVDALPARRLWVDALVVRQHPVTVGEYLAFLDALAGAGEPVDALLPRLPAGAPLVHRDGAGFALVGASAHPQAPTTLYQPIAWVDAASAERFAAWEAERSGIPWRLPHDLEWEKVARGVDGRAYPWGSRLDPSQACMQLSHVGVPTTASVHAYPDDVSVYGVRGLGGNVRDWCANGYRREGLPEGIEVVPHDPAGAGEPWRMLRGGSIGNTAEFCRAAGRTVFKPTTTGPPVGFRLCASFRDQRSG